MYVFPQPQVSWLVSWMMLQAAATLFCAKPCNVGQMQITAWSIKHARELATGGKIPERFLRDRNICTYSVDIQHSHGKWMKMVHL